LISTSMHKSCHVCSLSALARVWKWCSNSASQASANRLLRALLLRDQPSWIERRLNSLSMPAVGSELKPADWDQYFGMVGTIVGWKLVVSSYGNCGLGEMSTILKMKSLRRQFMVTAMYVFSSCITGSTFRSYLNVMMSLNDG
jgi:hypothetical protein